MNTPEHVPDELDLRIRSLQAERQRPVPVSPMAAALAAARAEAALPKAKRARSRTALNRRIDEFLAELKRDFDAVHTPPDSSTTTSTGDPAQTHPSSTETPGRARKSRSSDPQAKTRTIDVSETPSGKDEEAG